MFNRLLTALMATVSLAAPALAEDAANPFAKINPIVVIYTENRSFDNLFAEFPGADGLRPGSARGRSSGKT